MKIKRSRYFNFRNISSACLEFADGINIISGDNAEGKTNALEGIYVCSAGRSHRAQKDKELIKFGEDTAAVCVEYDDGRRLCQAGITYSQRGRKSCEVNSAKIKKMSEFIGNFRAVLFTPEHLSMIKGPPSSRRAFLDSSISQLDPVYVACLQNYNEALENRNRLLDAGSFADDEQLRLWSWQMAKYAVTVSEKRAAYIKKASGITAVIFEDMTSGREKLTLSYEEERDEESFIRLLTENLEREKAAGTTLYGVHRDDILIEINGRPAKSFASQGQQRSAALALKIAEGEIAKSGGEGYPVFLFDDLFSELDPGRKRYLTRSIEKKQVIITTCEAQGLDLEAARVIKAHAGSYELIG